MERELLKQLLIVAIDLRLTLTYLMHIRISTSREIQLEMRLCVFVSCIDLRTHCMLSVDSVHLAYTVVQAVYDSSTWFLVVDKSSNERMYTHICSSFDYFSSGRELHGTF
jgi:hypothetical protein